MHCEAYHRMLTSDMHRLKQEEPFTAWKGGTLRVLHPLEEMLALQKG